MSSRSDDPRRRPLARLRRDRGLRNATARRRSDRKAEDRNVTSDTLLAGKASEDQRPPPNSSRRPNRQGLLVPLARRLRGHPEASPTDPLRSTTPRRELLFGALARGDGGLRRLSGHVERLPASIQEQLGAAKFVVAEFSRRLFDPRASFLDPLSHRLLGFEKDGPFSARCCSSISNMMAACSMPAGSERGCRKGRSPCSIAG